MSEIFPRGLKRGIGVALTAALIGGGVAVAAAAPANAAPVATLTIDSAGNAGTPQHYGSGFIYGLTEDGQNPPTPFLSGIDFNYNRAGGAQLDVAGGWYGGTYDRHFQATLNQYNRVKTFAGAKFVLLVHDLYGADGSALQSWPGDNGDWSNFDAFIDRVIADVKKNNMDVEWDLWNEPDYPAFWPAGRQSQYLELWRRSYIKVREAFPDAVIVGPSTNNEPAESNSWWTTYLDFVNANNVVPNTISWHEIVGFPNGNDPYTSKSVVQSMIAARKITGITDYQVNEYGAPHEQYPAKSAWYLARLERADIHGLRSNWGSGKQLIDNAADLLYQNNGVYLPRGEWQTYASYAAQGGTVVPVETSTVNVDAYATRSTDDQVVQALVGSNNVTGAVNVIANQGGPVQPNANVRVIAEKVIEGNGRENRGPTFVSDTPAVVGTDGTLQTTLDLESSRDAYLVTIKAANEVTAADGRILFADDISQLRAGATSTVSTVYKNNGSTTQTGVSVNIVLPDGWTATQTEASLGTVSPGQTVTTAWTVTVPGSDVSKQRVIETKAAWVEAGQSLSSNVWVNYSVPCTLGFTCEWEEGSFSGAYLAKDHAGYTGNGFLGGLLGQGGRATLPFAVDADGTYTAKIRYSAGPDGPFAQADRTLTLSAGDSRKQITLPRTGSWDKWATVDVPVDLKGGTTDLTLSAEAGDTAWVNLDNMILSNSGTTPSPVPTTSPTPTPTVQTCTIGSLCEAESGAVAGGANTASDHPGFTGTGFIVGLVSPGASVTNTVTAPAAGNYVLTLRYAAGPNGPAAETDRTASVVVNGSPQVVTFPKTASWDAWSTTTTQITLPEGTSTLAVRVDDGETGWVNLDSMQISSSASTSQLQMDVSASTRKIGTKAYVTVTAVNKSSVPVTFEVVTSFGKKTFQTVQPGKKVSVSINSTKTSISAGKVKVTATGTIDGKKVTATSEASYNAQK